MFDFASFYLFLLTFAMKSKDVNYKSQWNILSFLEAITNDVRSEYVSWKNVWFCFISIVWVHKTEKFWFWKSLKYLTFFDKKSMSGLNMFCQTVWFGLSFVIWGQFWQSNLVPDLNLFRFFCLVFIFWCYCTDSFK